MDPGVFLDNYMSVEMLVIHQENTDILQKANKKPTVMGESKEKIGLILISYDDITEK